MDLVLVGSPEAPCVFDALAAASLVKASHLASKEKCHVLLAIDCLLENLIYYINFIVC